MTRVRQKTPWWCWLALFSVGYLSFIALFVAGVQLKSRRLIGLAVLHFAVVMIATPHSHVLGFLDVWLSLGLTVYLFKVVRVEYQEMEARGQLAVAQTMRENQLRTSLETQLKEEKIRMEYEKKITQLQGGEIAWTCKGCGAQNHNEIGVCDYCGVAVSR